VKGEALQRENRGCFMTASRVLIPKRIKDQKGATIVEFAIVALLFFTLLFGIIEFGILLFNQQVVTNAGREGARYGIVTRPADYKITADSIILKVKTFAEDYIVSFGDENFVVNAQFDSGLQYCEQFQDVLTVNVTYEYEFLFLPFAKKTLGTRAIMICE
jgi:Flp pilus assembly protein TadG